MNAKDMRCNESVPEGGSEEAKQKIREEGKADIDKRPFTQEGGNAS